MRLRNLLPASTVLHALLLAASARGQVEIHAVPLPYPPSFDSQLSTDLWGKATPFSVAQGTYQVAFDHRYIYLALRGWTGSPGVLTLSLTTGKGGRRELSLGDPAVGVLVRVPPLEPMTALRIPWTALGIDPEAQESITLEIRQTGSGESLATVKWTGMRLGLIRPTVEVAPYALTGGHPGENGFFQSGVDLASHYRNLNLLGSVNPDFRTVERSILSLDFSYFERLAPETRPFFTEGAAYFNPTGFASQRIDDFDAAAKAYGKVDRSTSVAALGGGTVGTDDFVVASVDRRLNDNGNISVGVKSFHGADFDNNYASGSANYTLGPLRFKTDVQLTADQAFGSGSSIDTSILYDKDGYFAHLTGITTSANFLDRLGYYTEPDIKGLNANLGKLLTFKSGSIESVGLSLATSQFTFQNNDPYRNYYSATGSMTIRKGPDITLSHLAGTFLSNKDRVTEGVISQPIQRGRGRVGADITAGQLDSHSYRSALLFLSYAPVPKLRLTGSFQELRHFANETQTILNADYDLGRGESISGRMVQFDNNWSFYLRYRKVQRDGTELQVLFGDPNSPTFDHVIMVKLVLPFTLRF